MGCIGSPNYLNLSPYKISSSAQRTAKSFTSHWFLIQVISSVIDIYSFGNSKQIYFSSENMVANGWFKMYLNQDQFNFLKDSTYFNLYPIEYKNKISTQKSVRNSGFYVHASKDWIPPPGSRLSSRISDTIFYVENLIINKELQSDSRILKIEPADIKQPLNRFVSGYLQSSQQKSVYSNNIFAPIRPLYELGLNGSNQVVNVVDSGVDVYNAFFYDPKPENNLSSITGRTNVNHRKIVRIEPIADNTDEPKGHGTHVSGTVCGSSFCTNCGISQYNGLAYASKLYFSDIGDSTTGLLSGTVDLNEQYKIFEQLGVHVSSNSWGHSSNNREIEFNYNKAAFEHPDVLYVFAAGNSQAYNTIYCPANSKNVLSVSAASFVSSAYLYFRQTNIEIQDESLQVLIQGKETTHSIIFKKSVGDPMKYYINLTLKQFSEEGEFNDSVVVLNTETGHDEEICQMTHKMQLLGAAATIFLTAKTEFYCDEPGPTIPMIKLVSKENITSLLNMKKVSLLPYSGQERKIPGADLLSSKGPADSGLRKPEIVIPGANIFSARSHGPDLEDVEITTDYDDSVHVLSGSSMATPSASAMSLIILQYLNEGFYPGLKKDSENSIMNVSSCLLRALLINTAIKPDSAEGESQSLPRNDVGFGTPFLHKILGFNDTGLRFVDYETIGQEMHRVYRIKVDSNKADLSVTLVYLDPPLDVDNEALLFADIDLYVKSPTGQIYNGNNATDGDTLSVIERVVFEKGEIPEVGGEFEIHVVSNKFPIDSQKVIYSIVVNGPFEMGNIEKNPLFLKGEDASENDCPNGCNGNGKCQKSHCVCNDAFVGLSCAAQITDLKEGESHSEKLNHGDMKYLRIPLTEKVEKIDFDILKRERKGLTYFCTSFEDSPGKLSQPEWTCYTACPITHPNETTPPSFANYSFDAPKDKDPKFLNLAFYTGYYKAQTVTVDNIKITSSQKPTEIPTTQTSTATDTEVPATQTSTATEIPTTQTSTATEIPTTQTSTATEVPATQTSTETTTLSVSPSLSASSSASDDSHENGKKKLPIYAIVILAVICIMVVVSIALVPLILCRKGKKQENSAISMKLLASQDI